MTKYVLLYDGGSMPEAGPETEKVMKAWETWFSKLGKAVVDQGDPFTPKAKSINSDGSVADGPVGGMASGYSILEADSLDAAMKMAKGCPVLQGGAKISVFETLHVM
jgi:hypothetical protein